MWTTPATSPPWATTQQLAASWLAHARRHAPDGNAVMLLDVVDLLADAGLVSPVVSLGNAAVTRCGLANPRWIYASVAAEDTSTLAFVGALGFVHVPELDVTDHRRPLITIVRDHGPGGVMAGTRDLVYRDLGLAPPTAFDNRDAVRQALRDYHDSIALAKNPLARGAGRYRERRPCVNLCSPHSTWRSVLAMTTSSPGPSSSAATSSPTADTTVRNANSS